MGESRTIRVTGKGMIRLKPDTVRVTMSLEGMEPVYADTLRRSTADTEALRSAVERIGFAREDLKTKNFNVQTEYEGYQEDGVYRQRLIGYRFRHELLIEFPWDNERLGTVLGAITETSLAPELRIAYTVKDREAAKNALLGLAVADAKTKAETLTAAAGVALGALQSIDYAWGEPDLEVRPMRKMAMADNAMAECSTASYDMNITPDDIQVSDTVTVIWEIGD